MPIQSYLLYPDSQRRNELIEKLNKIPSCEINESTNEDVLILVTDTVDEVHESQLQEKLSAIPEIKGMALVFAQEG